MSGERPTPSRSTAIAGFVGGIAAFIVGYAITYLWRGRSIERTIQPIEVVLDLLQAEPIGAWRVVGWLYYSAHFVDTRITARFGPGQATFYVDLVREGGGNLELLYLVPVVALLLAGLLVAWSARPDSLGEGAVAGATVALGYLVAVVVGLVVFAHAGNRPDPMPAILVAGVLYPVVFGGVGGAIGASIR
ncbi:MAG: transporter [Halobacteriota archaeon]